MRKILLVSILLSLTLPIIVLADCPPGSVCIDNPLQAESFQAIVDNIINFIFKIAIVLSPIMVIIGGFLLITAGGNAEQITRAKNLLLWTAIGFMVVLLSKGILAIINQILEVKGG